MVELVIMSLVSVTVHQHTAAMIVTHLFVSLDVKTVDNALNQANVRVNMDTRGPDVNINAASRVTMEGSV